MDYCSEIIEKLPIGICFIDMNGNIIEINDYLISILGAPSKESIKQINIFNYVPLLKTPLINDIQMALNQGKEIKNKTIYLTKWGKFIYTEYTIVPNLEYNNIKGFYLFVNDYTYTYESQKREELSQNKFDIINQFAYEINLLSCNVEPFSFIGEKLKQLINNCTISVNKYNKEENAFYIEYFYSPNQEILNKILEIKKNIPINFQLPHYLTSINYEGKLVNIDKEIINQLTFNIPSLSILNILTQAKVEQILTMGMLNQSLLLGNVTLFFHEKPSNIEVIEIFINQASLLITKHIHQNRVLENQIFYRSILNSINDSIIVVDETGKVVYVNKHYLSLHNENHLYNKIIGTPLSTSMYFINDEILSSFYKVKTNNEILNIQTSVVVGDKKLHLQVSIVPFINIQNKNYIIILKNISSIIENERKIQSLYKINQKIVNTLNDAVALIDQNKQLILYNEKFKELFTYVNNNVNLDKIHQNSTSFKDHIKNIFSGKEEQVEISFNTSENKQLYITKQLLPIIEDNEVRYILIIFKDITSHKQREKELLEKKQEAEKNSQLKSQLIASISHEIRNPLNSINGFASLLLKPDLTQEKRQQYILQIYENSNSLARLINDLIDYNRLENALFTLNYETILVNQFMDNLYTQYNEELKIRGKKINLILEKDCEEDFFFVIDKLRLHQILNNLLHNAIKYTPKGNVYIGYKLYPNSIIFYVKDNGIGIKPEYIDKIFEPFNLSDNNYTTEARGLGLGLYIVKQLCELMNGSIYVESELQKGSTFSIRFPFEKNENTYVSTTNNIKFSLPETSILIAEDDEINFLFLKEMLSEYPIHILHARNGKEAIKIFLDHKDNIDLILMDIQMPLMDGFQATAEIRKYNKEVPIIVQTAYAYSKEIELSKSVGCNDYLVKPIQQEELLTKIKEYVKTKT